MGFINSPLVTRTNALTHVVQAYTLTEDIPPATKRMLRDHVKGISLLVKAGEESAVTDCVTALRNTISEDVEESVVDWKGIIVRRCNEVLSVLPKREASLTAVRS
jgi:hypothetical protein